MAFLDQDGIERLGFRQVGSNVLLSDKASFYNCKNISIGDSVRIDDFCVLSAGEGGIEIESYVHVAAYSSLIGRGAIKLKSYSNLSSRVSVYSSSDDYSGHYMTNPMVPSEFTNVFHADVIIGRHVIIGAGCVVLPGVALNDGAAVGALSLINKDCEAFGVYTGVPARKIKNRDRNFLRLERMMVSDAHAFIGRE